MKKRSRIIAFLIIVVAFMSIIGTTVTDISKKINLGLDLQGGFEILYEVEPIDENQKVDRSLLEGTVQTLNDRVNRLGISETVIDIEGEDRIRVQLAGVDNQEEAREMLSTSARLSFRDINDKEHLSGSDIKEGSAKQDFHQDTNQPIVTLQLKDAEKFADVTTTIKNMGTGQNLLVIWMDFDEGEDAFLDEVGKAEPKYISAP
ncbi:MAG TPA: protein translocase subunit SecDF, partial [Candidatus Pseudogracilibacillus intestinigallinarum]|nr:protein translocase subunit SecDF [Candidatus Pseudogracilibacillus intestinigallinarum]